MSQILSNALFITLFILILGWNIHGQAAEESPPTGTLKGESTSNLYLAVDNEVRISHPTFYDLTRVQSKVRQLILKALKNERMIEAGAFRNQLLKRLFAIQQIIDLIHTERANQLDTLRPQGFFELADLFEIMKIQNTERLIEQIDEELSSFLALENPFDLNELQAAKKLNFIFPDQPYNFTLTNSTNIQSVSFSKKVTRSFFKTAAPLAKMADSLLNSIISGNVVSMSDSVCLLLTRPNSKVYTLHGHIDEGHLTLNDYEVGKASVIGNKAFSLCQSVCLM